MCPGWGFPGWDSAVAATFSLLGAVSSPCDAVGFSGALALSPSMPISCLNMSFVSRCCCAALASEACCCCANITLRACSCSGENARAFTGAPSAASAVPLGALLLLVVSSSAMANTPPSKDIGVGALVSTSVKLGRSWLVGRKVRVLEYRN